MTNRLTDLLAGIGIIGASLTLSGAGAVYCTTRAVNPEIINVKSNVVDDFKYDFLFCLSVAGGIIGTIIGSDFLSKAASYQANRENKLT